MTITNGQREGLRPLRIAATLRSCVAAHAQPTETRLSGAGYLLFSYSLSIPSTRGR